MHASCRFSGASPLWTPLPRAASATSVLDRSDLLDGAVSRGWALLHPNGLGPMPEHDLKSPLGAWLPPTKYCTYVLMTKSLAIGDGGFLHLFVQVFIQYT